MRLADRARQRRALDLDLEAYKRTLLEIKTRVGQLSRVDDSELQSIATDSRARASAGAPLDELLPEVYALACVFADRHVGMHPFDVQTVGAIALFSLADGRDEDGGGEDVGGRTSGRPQWDDGSGCARPHVQRLPGAPRRGLDEADLRGIRPVSRHHPTGHVDGGPEKTPTNAT